MKDLRIDIYTRDTDIPSMPCRNLFHSKSLFQLYAKTSHQKPFMVVATDGDGRLAAHLLAVVRYRWSFFPPYLYMHCQVAGEGEYETDGAPDADVFGQMLSALVSKMNLRTLYIEFSNISTKMFAYREFRRCGFFPVHWLNIHNSLHSKPPEERLTEKTLKRINKATERGATTNVVETEDDFADFMDLLRRHNRFKLHHFIPDDRFFRGLHKLQGSRLFLTRYKGKAIGCCACVYSGDDAYLWYSASLRKSYVKLHPDTVTVWAAIRYAYDHGYRHIRFLDVGMPFRRSPFRDFILRFGGKQVSTFRWFRVNIGWLNRLCSFFSGC